MRMFGREREREGEMMRHQTYEGHVQYVHNKWLHINPSRWYVRTYLEWIWFPIIESFGQGVTHPFLAINISVQQEKLEQIRTN